MKRRLLAIVLGTVMALSFAGCGDESSSQETSGGGSGNEEADSGEEEKPFEG